MNYARIAIIKKPGAFDAALTYKIPKLLQKILQPGHLVMVPLRGVSTRGIVVSTASELTKNEANEVDLKEIESLLKIGEDDFFSTPLLDSTHLELAQKMAIYYHYSPLRCLKLMLPKHLWKGTGKRILKKFIDQNELIPEPKSFPLKPLKHELNAEQKQALELIQDSDKPALLQGVTGSGKTEIYLHLMLEAVQAGKQAIFLLPEIGLTPQMIDYFSAYFGDKMALFHSKLSDGERLTEWLRVKKGSARVVIGSRSAIFAPVSNLGLIVMDEEHEWTYKQESSPYYQTHEVALMLKKMTDCRLVLGTATPRLETLYKAMKRDYTHAKLTGRINQKPLPKVEVVDLRDEFKKKNYSIFSHSLFNKIKDRLEKKEQVILFVNQRGVARAVVCRDCGTTRLCPDCEVSLKLHHPHSQAGATLLCHYCGYSEKPRLSCENCNSVNIKHVGIGTQRVEQDLQSSFPGIRVVRADKDTTSDKLGFKPIYEAFKSGEQDVLVGTQMVAKGHDFPNVTLIGIILADIGLHVPDFRSHERLFHLITQVSGRAGRAERAGEVVLQTYQPSHHAIQMAANYQFEDFATQELKFREKLNYPPFSKLIKFKVLGRDQKRLKDHIQAEKEVLEDIFNTHKLSVSITAAPAMIAKVGEFFHYHVLLRTQTPELIFEHWKLPKNWRIDIDPIQTT